MKVEKGMWIRTKSGKIVKVNKTNKDLVYYNNCNNIEIYCFIKKASLDIIDLIEVGDLVNGYIVEDIDNKEKTLKIDINYRLPNEYIKYILTKEQIKKYTVEVE